MCTELFLAFLYFSTILIVNYFLYNFSESESILSLKIFNGISMTKDIFLIGNIYKYLVESLKNKNTLSANTLYYLQLLQNQYLSNNLRLK